MFIFSKKEQGFPTFNIQNNLTSSMGPCAGAICHMQYQRNPEGRVGIFQMGTATYALQNFIKVVNFIEQWPFNGRNIKRNETGSGQKTAPYRSLLLYLNTGIFKRVVKPRKLLIHFSFIKKQALLYQLPNRCSFPFGFSFFYLFFIIKLHTTRLYLVQTPSQ